MSAPAICISNRNSNVLGVVCKCSVSNDGALYVVVVSDGIGVGVCVGSSVGAGVGVCVGAGVGVCVGSSVGVGVIMC